MAYKKHKSFKKGEDGKAVPVRPYDDAQRVLNKGWECDGIKDAMTFVTEDLLNQLFIDWIGTLHHEKERREFLYHQAVSLGAVQSNIESAVHAKNNKVLEINNSKKGDDQDDE